MKPIITLLSCVFFNLLVTGLLSQTMFLSQRWDESLGVLSDIQTSETVVDEYGNSYTSAREQRAFARQLKDVILSEGQ
jgi:hypothetical protein